MARPIITLPEPSLTTKLRIEEIKFYILLKHLNLSNENLMEITLPVLEALCKVFQISSSSILSSAVDIQIPRYSPTKYEIVVALAYCNIPIRKIYKYTKVHQRTYYEIIGKYLEYPTDLIPSFAQDGRIENIKKFNEKIKKIFEVTEIL